MAYTISIEWKVEDIINIAPHLSVQEAEEFLIRIDDVLTDRSIEFGWDVIGDLLLHEGLMNV